MAVEIRSERQLPINIEAEVCLLGSILFDNGVLADVLPLVDRESFYSPAHQTIFDACVSLFDAKKPIDAVILRDELMRRDALPRVGGAEYIATILEAVPSPANAEYYAKIVREKAILRRLLAATGTIEREILHPTMDVEDALEMAERSIFEIAQQKTIAKDLMIGDILKKAFKNISDIHDRKARISGLSTGFFELDERLAGLQPGQLIIVAGRPSMGKTSFAMRIAEHLGVVEEKSVLFFSLEMDAQNIAQNMLCSHAKISAHDLRRGRISSEDFQRLLLAAGKFYTAPILIDDSSSLTALELRARARRLKADKDIQLIMVDYLQLMEHKGAESRQIEISVISRSLKALAKELSVPVIALSQLSRNVEHRDDQRPRLSDLRESGAIEQDADVVMMLYRDEYYNREKTNKKGVAEVIIGKQRNGPTGTVELAFLANYMRFENLSAPKPEGS